MANLIGWVPIYGRNKALPVISYANANEATDFVENGEGLVKITDIIPKTSINIFPPSNWNYAANTGSNITGGDIEDLFYYGKIKTKSGQTVAGFSAFYYYDGTDSGHGSSAGDVFFGGLAYSSGQVYPVPLSPGNAEISGIQYPKELYVALTYNTEYSQLNLALYSPNDFYINSNYSNRIYVDGQELNLSDFEIFETEEDAKEKAGVPESPYEPGGTSSVGGGDGNFGKNPDGSDIPSDNIAVGIPNGSAETALSPGAIFTTYVTNNAELYDLSRWLWAQEGGLGGILFKEFLESLFGNFNDAIILFQSYPFAIDSMNVSTFVTDFAFGRADTRVQTLGLTNGSCSHNWGNVNISEYWGSFLDYAPHTKIELYLPWGVGTVQLDPNEIMGESLSVTTNFDLHKGACCHIVHTASGRVLGAYNGVCARQLPITGADTAGKATAFVASAVSLAVAAGAGIGAYNAGNQAFNKAIVEHTNRLLTDKSYTHSPEGLRRLTQEAVAKAKEPYKKVGQKAKVVAAGSAVAAFRIPMSLYRNGSFTAEGSGLGIQYPYLIITRPSQSVPQEYGHHYGYPSNIYSQLSALRGYTEIGEIHLTDVRGNNNVFATLEEMEEIEEILKGGVVF